MAKKAPKIKRPSKLFTEYYSSIILILITVLVGAGYFVIKPKIDDYKNIRAHTDSIRQSIENEQNYLAGLRRSVNAAEAIAPEVLNKVDSALPRSFSIPETLVIMNRTASKTNVKILSIVFSPGSEKNTKNKNLQNVQITLNVEAANYTALKNFLNSLEASLRLIDIQMLTVSDFSKESASFSLQLRTYYYTSDQE